MKKLLRIAITLVFCAVMGLCLGNAAWAENTEGVLILPASLQIVDVEAFYGSESIDKVFLPEGIKEIRARAFANSSVKKNNLPDSLTSIDDMAFTNPESITVTINRSNPFYNWAVKKAL